MLDPFLPLRRVVGFPGLQSQSAEFFVAHRGACHSDHRELLGERPPGGQTTEGREDLAIREITRGAKDDKSQRLGLTGAGGVAPRDVQPQLLGREFHHGHDTSSGADSARGPD